MTGLGIMGDAVQEFVGLQVDVIIDEMRRAAIDQDRSRANDNQK
jgi:hypothetical protein